VSLAVCGHAVSVRGREGGASAERARRRRTGENLGRFCLDRLGREGSRSKGALDSVACETLQGQAERHGECEC
jgi:hypothetical protein